MAASLKTLVALALLVGAGLVAEVRQASAASTRIVFIRGDEIRAVDPNGTRDHRLARLPGLVDIAAAENGNRIVALTRRNGGPETAVTRVWVMDGTGRGLRTIFREAGDTVDTVSITPGGRRVRYDEGVRSNYAFGPPRYLLYERSDERPSIRLAVRDCGFLGDLGLVYGTDPAVTATGRSFAFAGERGALWFWRRAFPLDCGRDHSTGEPSWVVHSGAGGEADPDFSPNGRSIVYADGRAAALRLFTVRPSGRNRLPVGAGVRGRAPQWTSRPCAGCSPRLGWTGVYRFGGDSAQRAEVVGYRLGSLRLRYDVRCEVTGRQRFSRVLVIDEPLQIDQRGEVRYRADDPPGTRVRLYGRFLGPDRFSGTLSVVTNDDAGRCHTGSRFSPPVYFSARLDPAG